MTSTGHALWVRHPHVRSGSDLTVGERASDGLKHWFGTWTLLGAVGALIVFWLLAVNDPGELHLNLVLSCMAAVQGIILQISANRGDRINAELATGTHGNTQEMLDLQRNVLDLQEQQMDVLAGQNQILAELRAARARAGRPAKTGG